MGYMKVQNLLRGISCNFESLKLTGHWVVNHNAILFPLRNTKTHNVYLFNICHSSLFMYYLLCIMYYLLFMYDYIEIMHVWLHRNRVWFLRNHWNLFCFALKEQLRINYKIWLMNNQFIFPHHVDISRLLQYFKVAPYCFLKSGKKANFNLKNYLWIFWKSVKLKLWIE